MERLSSKVVYKNRWLLVREDTVLQAGTVRPYGIVERPNSVIAIAMSPSQRIVLLEQDRYPTGEYSWELPMGAVNDGESALEAARRELYEETSIAAGDLSLIGRFYPVPALSAQLASVFLANVDEAGLDNAFSPEGVDDIVSAQVVNLSSALNMVASGAITDGFTLSALLLLLRETSGSYQLSH